MIIITFLIKLFIPTSFIVFRGIYLTINGTNHDGDRGVIEICFLCPRHRRYHDFATSQQHHSNMTEWYDDDGVRFAYPESWELTREDEEAGVVMLSVTGDGTSFGPWRFTRV